MYGATNPWQIEKAKTKKQKHLLVNWKLYNNGRSLPWRAPRWKVPSLEITGCIRFPITPLNIFFFFFSFLMFSLMADEVRKDKFLMNRRFPTNAVFSHSLMACNARVMGKEGGELRQVRWRITSTIIWTIFVGILSHGLCSDRCFILKIQ